MNVLHLNASDRRGGAALAAYRLHRGLHEHGIGSTLLVQEKRSADDTVEKLVAEEDEVRVRRAQVIEHVYRDRNRTSVTDTHFSFSFAGEDPSGHPAVRAADVIHLHWVASMQTPATIARLLNGGKPIVWTLHDLGPFTGGCHFPAGCRGFESSCSSCPQLRSDPYALPAAVLRDKRELWANPSRLTLVAPSRWIAAEAARSTLFRSVPEPVVIPNGVDPRVFRPVPKEDARAALGLPVSGTYVLCGAAHGEEKRKGLDLLRRVLRDAAEDPRFRAAEARILHVGELPAGWRGTDENVTSLGSVADEARMALAYAAADLFVLPSLEDNLPNMMLEAMSSATPVVAFAAGGIDEVLRDGENGRLVPTGDADGLARAILSLIADPAARESLGREARASIERGHTQAAQAAAHAELYERSIAAAGGVPMPSEPMDPSERKSLPPGPSVAAILPELTIHCLDEARRIAEADRIARGRVIETMQAALRRFEAECAARLRVIEELDAHRQSQAAHLADVEARIDAYERRLARLRRFEAALSFVRRMIGRRSDDACPPEPSASAEKGVAT